MELNPFRPPTSSDDLCLPFCLILILCLLHTQHCWTLHTVHSVYSILFENIFLEKNRNDQAFRYYKSGTWAKYDEFSILVAESTFVKTFLWLKNKQNQHLKGFLRLKKMQYQLKFFFHRLETIKLTVAAPKVIENSNDWQKQFLCEIVVLQRCKKNTIR